MGEAVNMWGLAYLEISVLSSQFCCGSKAALKKIVLKSVGHIWVHILTLPLG